MVTDNPAQTFAIVHATRNLRRCIAITTTLCLLTGISVGICQSADVGAFSGHGDIGKVLKSGAVKFDAVTGAYEVSGGGENMWSTNDALHYVWEQVDGDILLAADVRWPNSGGNAHRKACLIIRQSLDANSAYADAALHGDGLSSLQYRETQGGITREIQSNVKAPIRLRIEKRGDYVSMSVANGDESLKPAGGTFRIQFASPFYVGLGVCAHDNNALETAVFSKVEIRQLPTSTSTNLRVASTLEIVPIASGDRRVVYHTSERIEAPNWLPDGKSLLYNSGGRLYKIPTTGGTPELLNTGFANKCNNDHGISPDGKQIAISDSTEDGKSCVYTLPIGGGTPKKITKLTPSYWHGWSPNGQTLAYCAQRNGEFDIYTISAEGGEEKRLTTATGLDDGPEYSPDGKYIYFNSERTSLMQIWRMKPDGSDQEQITSDDYNNWFAHPSPDGQWIVFVSYSKDVKGHPANKDVMLRLKPTIGGNIRTLAKLFGGQGTLNVPSWSPDSRQIAFVSYQPVPSN